MRFRIVRGRLPFFHGAGPQVGSPGDTDRERAFRMTILLAAVFVFNAFDLALTESQLARGGFVEANVLAVAAVASGPAGMAAYKAVLLGGGVYILYRYRRRRVAELAAWVLTACCAGLMFWWQAYLDALEICLQDPTVGAPPLM